MQTKNIIIVVHVVAIVTWINTLFAIIPSPKTASSLGIKVLWLEGNFYGYYKQSSNEMN